MNKLISTVMVGLTMSISHAGEEQGWLDAHNNYRSQHQVGNLQWSDKLANSAQQFANTCPRGHSNSGYGENLAFASFTQSPENVVARWYSEVKDYDYQNPNPSSTGHFTQVVWKSTTHVGCATINTCGGTFKSIAVCQYSPPGNYIGRFRENVFPKRVKPQPAIKILSDGFEN